MGQIVRICIEFFLIFLFIAGGKTQDENANCPINDTEGLCVPLNECPPLQSTFEEIINGKASNATSQEFERSFCADRSLICCPASKVSETPVHGSLVGVNSLQFLLPERSGFRAVSDRITNGDDASLLAWPWIALLRGRVNNNVFWICGGTLISNRYVLTAAHCFTDDPNMEMEFVRIGEHDLSTNIDCEDGVCAPPAQDIPIEQIVLHHSYRIPCHLCNDIALLRLSREAIMQMPFVNSISLPVHADYSLGFSGQESQSNNVRAAGWGWTNSDSQSRPKVLQEIYFPIQANSRCNFLKRKYENSSTAFCAGGGDKDTCKGDSGGPVTVTDLQSQRVYLIGITSAGHKNCGKPNNYGLYTNVYRFVPWILSNMRK